MKILYATSEAAPFAASGGLGDVLGALPKTIVEVGPPIRKHEVCVVLPLYGTMSDANRAKLSFVTSYEINYSWRKSYCGIYKCDLNGVHYYFIDNEQYFKRKAFYGEPDDMERFAFFSMAVIEFMLRMNFIPDILHANDWQTAMTVVYLKTLYKGVKALHNVKTVYSIHNIEYQGKCDPYCLGDIFGLDVEYKYLMEFDGCLNVMKAAMESTDHLSTVSPNYAKELEYDFFAFGLQEIVKKNAYKMSGVINGIDTTYFSPSLGGDIEFAYDVNSVEEGKKKNKLALQKALGLEENANIPMISMITRLTATKGLDLVLRVLPELLEQNIQFVILGTGEKNYETSFQQIEARYPNKLKALIKFDRILSKEIYASSDIFLMPSKSEPCGLSQMIACSYGTVPVVRSAGGLYDSIHSYGEKDANGFRFDNFNAHEMLYKLQEALSLYENKEEWQKLVKSAMNTDFTWQKSAKKYLDIYKSLK